jgi:probable HAF family extracellular repeat protein
MKSISVRAAAILIVATMSTVLLSAQQTTTQAPENQIPRYRLIDLGTLGGPNSSEFASPVINNQGTITGGADTADSDPNAPNCYSPDCFVMHAYIWRKGVLADLGGLPGGFGSEGNGINDHNQIAGQSLNGLIDPLLGTPAGIAVLWQSNGQIVDLGTLGGNQSLAATVNNRGQVVGGAANAIPDEFSMFGWATQTRAFLWQSGIMRDLGTLGGPDAFAVFVNERGQVAGVAYTNSSPNSGTGIPTQDPFLWEHGRMKDLGTLGGTLSFVNAFNNLGQVAGESNLPGDLTSRPFLWNGKALKDLGSLGGSFGFATALNDLGEVGGGAWTADDEALHAFLWTNGVMKDLGTINDDTCSVVHGTNSRGLVVGTSGDCPHGIFEQHGFLSLHGGPLIDLNNFVPPQSDLVITDGESINNRGEIAGSGMLPSGDFHAIVLVPCDDAEEDCLNARENLNSGLMAAPHPLLRDTSGRKLNAREILAAVHSRMARRYHGVKNAANAHP